MSFVVPKGHQRVAGGYEPGRVTTGIVPPQICLNPGRGSRDPASLPDRLTPLTRLAFHL
jgi:hypothetical protein